MNPSFIVGVLIVAIWVYSSVHILREYERGVIFRLGKVLHEPKGPRLIMVLWPIDKIVRVDLRIVTLDVPPQDIITRDNVSVKVNAVVFYRVMNARDAIIQVERFLYATSQAAQTTLRSVLGESDLDELLSKREKLNTQLQAILDERTDAWGIKVTAVEVKTVDLPQEMVRAISKQAEAERERRAKVIHAEGEYQASERLAQAAETLAREPTAIQLRYLQTLTEIGTTFQPLSLQLRSWRHVSSRHHDPSSLTSPRDSATGMNSAGPTSPSSALLQRSNASNPTTVPVGKSILG